MMAMNWPKHVVGYYLEYTFFLYLVVLLTAFNIHKFPQEISTTGKNNILNSLTSHLGSSSVMWWLIWIRSLVCGLFSDSVISSFSSGTIFMIWRGSGRKRPSHNLSFSVSVFAGSNWGYLRIHRSEHTVSRWKPKSETFIIEVRHLASFGRFGFVRFW